MKLFARDEVYVGRDMGGHERDLTPELITKFTAGTGDANLWYSDKSPLGYPIAPALILHSEVYSTLAWYLPNLVGNLHARQEWEIFAPVAVGEKVHTRSVVVDRYLKRNREFVVNEVLVFKADGQLVSRSRTHQSFLTEVPTGMAVDKSREKSAERVFKVGERGSEPFSSPLRKIDDERCMAFSGPALNYHNNREKAIEWGFPEIVVQGMLSICIIAEMMTARFGLGFFYGGKLALNLVNVVWGNDSVGPRGVILERKPEGKHQRAECEVWCEKADGTKAVVGTASALEL